MYIMYGYLCASKWNRYLKFDVGLVHVFSFYIKFKITVPLSYGTNVRLGRLGKVV